MDKTRIEQDSIEVTLADGKTAFRVTTTVTDPGILPDTGLFVFTIVDPLEPKSDTFIRVAQPHDINFMLRDRDNAVAAGDTEFLYLQVAISYESIEVAVQAKTAIKSRIDAAISRWYVYQTEFVGVENTLHPGVDPEYEQALKAVYVTARDARVLAETAVEDADDAVAAAQVLLEHVQEISEIRKTETEFCAEVNTTLWPQVKLGWTAFNAGSGALYTASKSFWTSAKAFDDIADPFYSTSSTFWTNLIVAYNAFPTDPPVPVYNGPPAAPTTDWLTFYNELKGYDGVPAAFNALLTTYGTAVSTYGPHTSAGTSLAAFQTVLDAYTSTATLISSMTTAMDTFYTAATVAYSAAVAQVTQKEAGVTTAVNAKNEAEAELASAQETEDAALAAVEEICPDFETTSV